MMLYSRNEYIYKRVEEYKDFELTLCLTYEMSIRNKDTIKDIVNIDSIIADYNYLLQSRGHKKKKGEIKDKYTYLLEMTVNGHLQRNKPILERIKKHMFILLPEDLLAYIRRESYSIFSQNLIFITSAELCLNYYSYHYQELKKWETERLRYRLNSHQVKSLVQHYRENNSTTSLISNLGYSIFAILFNSEKSNYEEQYTSCTHQLPIGITHALKKKHSIPLDSTLSDEENIQYIKRRKKKLLGIEENAKLYARRAQQAIEKSKVVGISYKENTIQNTYADMFFIYDVLSSGYFKKDTDAYIYIKHEIKNHYTNRIMLFNNLKAQLPIIETLKQLHKTYIEEQKNRRPEDRETSIFSLDDDWTINSYRKRISESFTDIKTTTIKSWNKLMISYIDNMEYRTILKNHDFPVE
ncbi:hypothetical protein [Sulfurimonas sp.]|jgi:hypothetical protein|uniref:hypothetical protein n=1 Tax=Sulfurimonas sp. TaxID=2022749 RepID=UPI0025F31D1B|nr:hypothetical protein [Sulfurimonas sp.]MBT5934542.1 hypothetical protein [Sulfurimonas sp.]